MVMHASRQPPRQANSISSAVLKKARCLALFQKRYGAMTFCKADFRPRGLLLIGCPMFHSSSLVSLSHDLHELLDARKLACSLVGFWLVRWLAVCVLFGSLFASWFCSTHTWLATLLSVAQDDLCNFCTHGVSTRAKKCTHGVSTCAKFENV